MKKPKIALVWGVVGLLCLGGIYFIWRGTVQKDPAHYYVPFDISMQLVHHPIKDWPINNWRSREIYSLFKTIYEKKSFKHATFHAQTRVPMRIHQIWLGSPFPEKYRAFQESWKKYHPDWEYYLWTDAELEKFNLYNRALYDASTNYGEKSDIARYEILHKMGGLYVDTDFECLKPFDLFNHCYDFYIGIQPLDTAYVQLGIGLIGATAGHPLLKQVIERMRGNAKNNKAIITRTGPLYFTQVFCAVAPFLKGEVIAFPATYFYPKSYAQKDDTTNVWVRPESFAVHHWEASWLKPEAFVKG